MIWVHVISSVGKPRLPPLPPLLSTDAVLMGHVAVHVVFMLLVVPVHQMRKAWAVQLPSLAGLH